MDSRRAKGEIEEGQDRERQKQVSQGRVTFAEATYGSRARAHDPPPFLAWPSFLPSRLSPARTAVPLSNTSPHLLWSYSSSVETPSVGGAS